MKLRKWLLARLETSRVLSFHRDDTPSVAYALLTAPVGSQPLAQPISTIHQGENTVKTILPVCCSPRSKLLPCILHECLRRQ